MTTKQTFIRAFRRAVKSGYEPIPHHKIKNVSVTLQNHLGSYVSLTVEAGDGKLFSIMVGLNEILFDHEFAQALWDDIYWQANLQKMAVAPNPIVCLGELL